jgi:hypothetical protein
MNTNGGLSWINYLDAAVLSASSEASGLPVGNLQVLHLSTKWRSDGMLNASLMADYGTALPVDVLGIFGGNFSAACQWRIKLSSTAAHDGDLYDSGLVAMNPDIRVDRRKPTAVISKSQAVHLLAAPVTARYRKMEFQDTGLSYLEAGLAWDGKLTQFERNFAYGQAPQTQDPSTITTSRGGNAYTDLRPQFMTDSFTFPALTEDEAKILQAMDEAVGTARNLLWLRNPNQASQNKTALLGYQLQIGPMPIVAFNRRSRQFQLAERL